MLLLNYDFYDIHAALIRIRHDPTDPHHTEVVRRLRQVIDAPQTDNVIGSNLIRRTLSQIDGLDRDTFAWVYTENIYTYGVAVIKDSRAYEILSCALGELLLCLESGDASRAAELADALHNIPILLTAYDRKTRKRIAAEVSTYRQSRNHDFLRDVLKK
ncbi:MAG: hypothetical protein IJW99_11905 [Clostridia bacterium]|nr:hypothetical protein [Clostridia bacterium]